MPAYLRQFMMPQLQHRGQQFAKPENRQNEVVAATALKDAKRPRAAPATR